jgi:hypothetical protein
MRKEEKCCGQDVEDVNVVMANWGGTDKISNYGDGLYARYIIVVNSSHAFLNYLQRDFAWRSFHFNSLTFSQLRDCTRRIIRWVLTYSSSFSACLTLFRFILLESYIHINGLIITWDRIMEKCRFFSFDGNVEVSIDCLKSLAG